MFLFLLSARLPLRPADPPFHFEPFSTPDWTKRWHVTTLENYTGEWRQYETPSPQNYREEKMIFATNESAFYGLSTKFDRPIWLHNMTLTLQYEIRLTNVWECAGAYIKLFPDPSFDPLTLSNETDFLIMFGPDKCMETNRVHFIFWHPNQVTHEPEQHHLIEPPEVKTDKVNHLYSLIVRPNYTYAVLVDGAVERNGSMFTDFSPPINPPKTLDDPTDEKPADWPEDERIDDPDARKPDDWDEDAPEYVVDTDRLQPPDNWFVHEPRFIPDPAAQKPSDWDDETNGDWEPPMIANPKCEEGAGCGEYEPPMKENPDWRGEWTPPKIKNPKYKGPWRARQIPNPAFVQDLEPFKKFPPIWGMGFELWIVTKDTGFGNVYVGTDEAAFERWNNVHFKVKHPKQAFEFQQADDLVRTREQGNGPSPTPPRRPRPSLRTDGEGITGVSVDFVMNLVDAWKGLYDENPQATLLVTFFVVSVPVAIFICIAFHLPAPEALVAKKTQQKKKPRKKKKRTEEPTPLTTDDVAHRTGTTPREES
jgi:calnexin